MPAFDPITARSQAVPDLHYLDGGPPYRAGLDRLQLPYVSGWALDLREPGREVHVAIQVDGLTLGRCEAREERDDIAYFVPGVRPGFVMRLTGGASEDIAAVVARLMGFDDARLAAPAPVTLRLDDEATFHGGDGFDLSAAELLALLLHAPSPGLAAALEVEPDAPAGPVAMLAGLSTELLLFDESAYLRANPKARDEGRSELGAAFRHWVASGGEAEGFENDHRTPVTSETECLLLAELALAEGRPGAARHWLRAALNRLLGPQPQDFAEAVEQVLDALEVSGEAAGPRRGAAPLMARMAYAGALALGPAAAGRLLPRLAAANLALHPARRFSASRDTDLHWWARLGALLLRSEREGVRELCLQAWRQVSPEQRRRADTPVPPTARMRRLLLLCWSASTHGQGGAGDAEEALAAALALSRELVGVREQPWRGVLRGALREAYARGRPDAATLAAILCAGFEAGFGPSRLGACGVLLRTLGLETAGMARLSPPDEAVRRGRFDVGFLVGMREGESYRYRVLNIADALEDAGLAVTTLLPGEDAALLERCTELGRLVVFRAALDAPVRAMLEAANRLGATVSYDVDDLVFDPSLAPQIKALDLVSPEERAYTIGWMRRYREAMVACDAGTVSTEQLRARMAAMGLPASVVPNTHGPFERAIAGRARREPDQPLTVAYFSGTWTHHADFEQCDAALRAVLRRHPEVRFLLAGNLRLGPAWAGLEAQVERAPFLPHPMMLALHARVDVSLAPLELGNAFCDSKSELKIFEAALFGVPSIASPTRPYAAAMEAGVSGLLAATPSEWEAALERLIADAGLRARMGEAARLRAERDFADTEAAARFAGGLEAVPRRRRLSLCVMLPRGMARGVEAAGLDAALRRDVLALCRGLAVLGHKVVAAAGPQEPREGMAELRAALAESGVRLEHRPPRLPFDLVIATTPAALEPAMAQCEAVGGNPLRLAMTYEPWLHPVGEALLQAEASLEHVVPTIARTPFLARLLHGLHGVEAAHFDLAPDRTAFFPRPEVRREPLQVVALSRPGVAGSCHGLAMRALRLLRAREPRLDIVLLGSPAEAGLGEPLSRHGWPLHPDAAARFFSAGTVGLCLSPTGQSREALEMIACGLPVVDVAWRGRRFASELERQATLAAAPSAEAICAALHAMLHDPVLRERHVAAGTALLDGLPGPIGQARQLEALLLQLAPAA